MNYGKANSNKLWKFHYDELYRKIHSNELEHIVLVHSWTCYSILWACCSSLWHIINQQTFWKTKSCQHTSYMKNLCAFKCFNTWVFECIHEILSRITTLMWQKLSTLRCLSVPKSSKQKSFDVKEKQWNNRRKKIEGTLETLNKP